MKTFTNSEEVLQYLQSRYGTADYKSWQVLRKQYYSYVKYLEAGQSSLTFFADALGVSGATAQQTNMPKANSFGQNHFLLKAIRTHWRMPDPGYDNYDGTDASTIYSDIVNGLFQTGVLEFTIGSKVMLQLPKPFLLAPPAWGRLRTPSAGLTALTLTEGTPNTLNSVTDTYPWADLNGDKRSLFIIDRNILIEAEQYFTVTISWPAGVLAAIATGPVNDASNPLWVGVSFDGLVFRPVQ